MSSAEGLDGKLDQPKRITTAICGALQVRGWLYHEPVPVRSVWLYTPTLGDIPLRYGMHRPDVVNVLGDRPGISHCGFVGTVVIDDDVATLALELRAELADGRRVHQKTYRCYVRHSPKTALFIIQLASGGELRGSLDGPQKDVESFIGPIESRGWILSSSEKIRSIWVEGREGGRFALRSGVLRPDVALQVPLWNLKSVAGAGSSGFSGILVPEWGAKQLALGLWVELDSGERVRCLTRRCISKEAAPYRIGSILGEATWKTRALLRSFLAPAGRSEELSDPFARWRKTNHLTPKLTGKMCEDARKMGDRGPTISLILALQDPPEQSLQELLASVVAQIYGQWELCIADDGSRSPSVQKIIRGFSAKDTRVRSILRPKARRFADVMNAALDLATANHIAFIDHDGILPPDALLHIGEHLRDCSDTAWLYTDEAESDRAGRPCRPRFKGSWNPALALTHNESGRLTVLSRMLVNRVGRVRDLEGAEELDLLLRVAECCPPDRIHHLPKICYHRRSSGAPRAKNAQKALARMSERRALRGEAVVPEVAARLGVDLHRMRWDPALLAEHPVTIVIPTRNRADLLRACISSLERTVDARWVKLIVVDDASTDADTLAHLAKLEHIGVLGCRVVRDDQPRKGFNYARLMNVGMRHVATPYALHLNNDVEAVAQGWLEEMVGWLTQPGVGVVGAKLLYPNRTIQHGGVVIGPHDGLADHWFAALPAADVDHGHLPYLARDVSAVTGACLLTPTKLFRELCGFDERAFPVSYNDVDYCLRVRKAGGRVVWTPNAELVHTHSASLGADFDPAEHGSFLARYPRFRDPFFNENLNIDAMWMEPNPHHHVHAARAKRRLRILVPWPELRADAARALLDTLRGFVDRGEHEVTLLLDTDGAARRTIEAAGVAIRISPSALSGGAIDREAWRGHLRELGRSLDIRSFDLVLGHGLASASGIELADCFDIPSIWRIYEGRGPLGQSNGLDGLVKAKRVVFAAPATADLYRDYNVRDHHRVIRNGIPIGPIDEFIRLHTRAALRAERGIAESDFVAASLSSVSKDDDYQGQLALADLFVLPTSTSAVPRIVLEAMAFGRPVVAPKQYGLPELVSDGGEGSLFEPGDEQGMARAISRLEQDSQGLANMGRHAFHKVRRLCDADKCLDRWLDLLKEAVVT